MGTNDIILYKEIGFLVFFWFKNDFFNWNILQLVITNTYIFLMLIFLN
jgi:hypothetical protein